MSAPLIEAPFHVVLKLHNQPCSLNLLIRGHVGANEVDKRIAPDFDFGDVLFLNAKLLGHHLRREGVGEFIDKLALAALNKAIDQLVCHRFKMVFQSFDALFCKRLINELLEACVRGGIIGQ